LLTDVASHYKVDTKALRIAVAKAEKDKRRRRRKCVARKRSLPEIKDSPQITAPQNRTGPSLTGRPRFSSLSFSSKISGKILTLRLRAHHNVGCPWLLLVVEGSSGADETVRRQIERPFFDVIPVFRVAPFSPTLSDARHAAPLLSSTARRPSQHCGVTTFLVRSPPSGDARATVPSRVACAFRFPKTAFNSFHSFIPSALPLGTASGNSCALQLRLFCFSVSSQKLFANDIEDFLCPSRNADPRFGSRPLSLLSAPLQGQKWRLKKCTKIESNSWLFGQEPESKSTKKTGRTLAILSLAPRPGGRARTSNAKKNRVASRRCVERPRGVRGGKTEEGRPPVCRRHTREQRLTRRRWAKEKQDQDGDHVVANQAFSIRKLDRKESAPNCAIDADRAATAGGNPSDSRNQRAPAFAGAFADSVWSGVRPIRAIVLRTSTVRITFSRNRHQRSCQNFQLPQLGPGSLKCSDRGAC